MKGLFQDLCRARLCGELTGKWHIGEPDSPKGLLCTDLKVVIQKGFWNFQESDVPNLAAAIGSPQRLADLDAIRGRLLKLLTKDDHGVGLSGWDRLCPASRFNLTLFRAERSVVHLGVNDARKDASRHIRKRALSADAVKRPGGPEELLVSALLGGLLAEPATGGDGHAPSTPPSDRVLIERAHPLFPTPAVGAGGPTAHKRLDPSKPIAEDPGFWWRSDTETYLQQLGKLRTLTIYAGAEGWSDVGPPVHRDLLTTVLIEQLAKVPKQQRMPPMPNDEDMATVLSMLPPEYLGSILREISSPPSEWTSKPTEIDLHDALQHATTGTRQSGGLVARAIAHLAFTLAAEGGDARVFTAHFDDDIAAAEGNRKRHYGREFAEVGFKDVYDRQPETANGVVSLLRVHGRLNDPTSQSIVLGEADFIANEPVASDHEVPPDHEVSPDDDAKRHVPRMERLVEELRSRPTLFVGTSIRDPGVIAALTLVRHVDQPRYAVLLLPPDLGDDPVVRIWTRWLLGRRYLHLGVTPIFADFPSQVPQFLREIALRARTRAGGAARAYGDRLDDWWKIWGGVFGYDEEGERVGSVAKDTHEIWLGRMRFLQSVIAGDELGEPLGDDERITINVWLRNRKKRELFRWATVGRPRGKTKTRDVLSLGHSPANGGLMPDERLTLAAFKAGELVSEATSKPREGWIVAMNLVLRGEPWDRLTVGVVTIESNDPDGALNSIVTQKGQLSKLAGVIDGNLREMLLNKDQDR